MSTATARLKPAPSSRWCGSYIRSGTRNVFLVVLGGMVPEALVPEHLGTTDVDVLLITQSTPTPILAV